LVPGRKGWTREKCLYYLVRRGYFLMSDVDRGIEYPNVEFREAIKLSKSPSKNSHQLHLNLSNNTTTSIINYGQLLYHSKFDTLCLTFLRYLDCRRLHTSQLLLGWRMFQLCTRYPDAAKSFKLQLSIFKHQQCQHCQLRRLRLLLLYLLHST
jgi:hypothetical protein